MDDMLTVYPNPSKSVVYLKCGDNALFPFSVTVYDMAGRALRSGNIAYSAQQMNLRGLSGGVYQLALTGSNGCKIVKRVEMVIY